LFLSSASEGRFLRSFIFATTLTQTWRASEVNIMIAEIGFRGE